MHKTFISYHHQNDQDIKNEIIKKFSGDQFIDKSVGDGDINTNNTEETILRIIREDFLADSTVTLVIIGEETAKRPFVNSEIQASLWGNNPNGLLAVVRDEVYEEMYTLGKCTSTICNCGTPLRLHTSWFKYYLPDLVYKNHLIDKQVPHYNDDEVYCSITKYSLFMQDPESYIDKAFEKRQAGFDIKKRLSPETPKIQARNNPFNFLL